MTGTHEVAISHLQRRGLLRLSISQEGLMAIDRLNELS
jgi:hypothetical protein